MDFFFPSLQVVFFKTTCQFRKFYIGISLVESLLVCIYLLVFTTELNQHYLFCFNADSVLSC